MKQAVVYSLLVLIILGENVLWTEGASEAWCDKEASECHFVLVVDYRLTMMHGKTLVKAKDGFLYSYDVTNYTSANPIRPDDVITADAHPEPKLVMTFNGTIPGPALHMYEGQKIHVRVINNLLHETTSVHFHGQYQRGTPFSDGVPAVTQCPILPGQIFTQIFTANPKGTSFYHGHSGPQLNNGLYGAFIVHSKTPETYDLKLLVPSMTIPRINTLPPNIHAKEHVLIFQDYNHDWECNMVTMKMRYGQYQYGKKIPTSKSLAGINYSAFHFHSGLINGRGRFYDKSGKHNGGPLPVFTMRRNAFHRLRLVNSGDINPFRVSIDSHKLLVISSDGYDIEPVIVDSLIISPGERFDIVVLTDQPHGNYMIRGQTLEVGLDNKAEAILSYEGFPETLEPIVESQRTTKPGPTVVLNCPFTYYPVEDNTICYNFDRIKGRNPNPLKHTESISFEEHFMNFAFPGYEETPGSVNGRAFVSPPISTLSQPNEATMTCSRKDCGEDKVCHCPYTVSLRRNSLVQLVFSNIGQGKGWDHPIHLHGHSFQVIKMVYPTYNATTGKFIKQNDDIKCKGSFCNEATWRNSSWADGNLPDVELDYPPTKDNIIVPSGGYAVVRFKADNPGLWIIHCHLGLHLTDGMAAVMSEDKPNWPHPPQGFPTCRNYVPESHSVTSNYVKR